MVTQSNFNTTQVTVVDETFSNNVAVTSGVPQGSVLGPLLFLVYIEDLIKAIGKDCTATTVYAYADDIKLLGSDSSDLQKALDIVGRWTRQWDLQLNTNKSEHLTVREDKDNAHTFTMDNEDIPKVRSVRDLGIVLSEDLRWKPYVDKIRSRSTILCHTILRSFSSSDHILLVNLFKTYVRPILEYNTCSWSPHLKSDIDSIEGVQHMFTKRVCQRSNIKFSSYSDRLSILNLESLHDRRKKNDLIFLYKILHGYVDINYSDFFKQNDFHGHNLRRHKSQ